LKPWDAIHRPEVGLHYNRRMQMNEIIAALDSETARLEQANLPKQIGHQAAR
jgi:hypothetical protein